MYKINFNHLFYFLTISKEGSIIKASKKLHITQPALSHQLKILEQDLGKKLFDRVGRGLVINKDGEYVKEYASKIFRHSEEMIHHLKADTKEIIKIIRIGTVPWLSVDQTYDFIKPLVLSKQIEIEVYEKDQETLIKDLQNNCLDIILCDSPYSGGSKKLHCHLLATDSVICVSSSKIKRRGRFPKCIEELDIVNYSGVSMLANNVNDFLRTENIKTRSVGSFSDASLARTIVEKGRAIGFFPSVVVKQSLKSKTLVKVGEIKKQKSSLWAITRTDYKEDKFVSSIINNRFKK